MESEAHVKTCGDIKVGWCHCKTPQQELHEWEDYAAQNLSLDVERTSGALELVTGNHA